MRFQFLLVAFVLASAALPTWGQASDVTGEIRRNDTALPSKSAVGVWDPAKHELTVYLLPFKPDEVQVARIRRGRTTSVLAEQPSPDPDTWTWCPAAKLVVVLDPKVSLRAAGRSAIKRYHAVTLGIGKKDHSSNLVRTSSQAGKEFKSFDFRFDAKKGTGRVSLRVAGTGKIFNDEFKWRYSGRCGVGLSESPAAKKAAPPAAAPGSWVSVTDPVAFGLRGQRKGPFRIGSSSQKRTDARLEGWPGGTFDGVSVEVGFPKDGKAEEEVRGIQGGVSIGNGELEISVDRSGWLAIGRWRNRMYDRLVMQKIELKEKNRISVVLSGSEAVVSLEDAEVKRVPFRKARMTMVSLVAVRGAALFEGFRLKSAKE